MPLATVRSTATTRAQLSLETTPGAGTLPSKRLPSLTVIGHPEANTNELRGMGYKAPTNFAENEEWSAFTIEGDPTFDELTYIFNSLLVSATPTVTDTTAHTWTFVPSQSNPDPASTYCVQVGDDTNGGWQSNYVVVDGCTFTFSRKEVKVSGTMIGQLFQTGITIVTLGTVTDLPKVPVLATNVDLYMDTTFVGLGTTRLPNSASIDLAITERWKPFFGLNSSQQSFGGLVEAVPKFSAKLLMEANTVSDSFLAMLRSTTTKYFQIHASSTILAGSATAHYDLKISFPGQVSKPGNQSDQEGAWSQEWEISPVFDDTAAYFISATLVNKTATL